MASSVLRTEVILELSSEPGHCRCFRGWFEAYGCTWMVVLSQVPETRRVNLYISFDATVPTWTGQYENLRTDTYSMSASVLGQNGAQVGGITAAFVFKGSDGHSVRNFCTLERVREFILTRKTSHGRVGFLRMLFEVQKSSGTGDAHDSNDNSASSVGVFGAPPPPQLATPRRQYTMNLFNSPDSSDFKIRADGRDFPVHSIIVAGQSLGISAMLEEAKKSGDPIVVINDVNADIMEAVLKYLYNHDMPAICKSFEMLLGLLDAAEKYSIKTLISGVEQFVSKLMDSDFDGASIKVILDAFLVGFRLELVALAKRSVDSLKRRGKSDPTFFSSNAFQMFFKAYPETTTKMLELMNSP